MKKFKTGDAATRPHKDQRPSSSEKHPRNDGYQPTRLRNRTEKALQNADAAVRQEKNEDTTTLLECMAFGDVKHYPTVLRANVEVSDPRKRSLSLEWKGRSGKQELKVIQYDRPTNAFTLRAKFSLGADSAASHQVRLFREVQGIEIWKKATHRTQQSIWWAFNLSLANDEQVKRAKHFWDHVSYFLKRESLQELQYVNLVREGAACQKETRKATHRPGLILKVPGEKHAWSFTGFLNHPELLQARDSLRRVVAQNAPEDLLGGMEEEEPEYKKNMRDVNEVETANGTKSQDSNPQDLSIHHHSSGRPTNQHPPGVVYDKASRSATVQTQKHHTPKVVLLDGSAPTARDKRQKATTARRSIRRMAKK